MSALLQISDPHFGTERSDVLGALEILAARLAPTLIVMSGDVTQRATPDEFGLAAAFMRRLNVPATLVIPGNHDIPLLNLPLRIVAPYARFRTAFSADLEPIHDDAKLLVIGVNTVVPRWHKDGAVSSGQIERVAARLRRSDASQVRIVVCHHPVLVIRAEDEENLLVGSVDAIRRWVDAGADLILGGHIHLPYLRSLHERVVDLRRNAWCLQGGTAASTRVRSGAPNSVNHLRPTDAGGGWPGCIVERWDYIESSSSFEIVTADRLVLDRGVS